MQADMSNKEKENKKIVKINNSKDRVENRHMRKTELL